MPGPPLSRRQFLGVTLVGLTRKSGRTIEGELVHESWVQGHRLRDGGPFPAPTRERRTSVVIVGGGIAGLSAAWRLQNRGVTDFVLLEMEPDAGGNARSGSNAVSAYPWAAHYVPVPGPKATLVRELFAELGVLGADGTWREETLCQAPQERLFLYGQWQDGLEPRIGPSRRDRDQYRQVRRPHARDARDGRFHDPDGPGRAGLVRPGRVVDGVVDGSRGLRLAVAPLVGRLRLPRRLRRPGP